jgi:hypothetical protein
MDISNAILAKSDQLNSTDLASGPRTVVITDVKEGSDDQPVNVYTDVFGRGRPFKPSKTVLRQLGKAWGRDTSVWVGRSATLFRDPTVKWAGEAIGGIRILALSHIDKAMSDMLPTSKGKFAKYTISVLDVATVATPAPTPTIDPQILTDWLSVFANAATLAELQAAWKEAGEAHVASHPQIVAAKDEKKLKLSGEVRA